MKAKGLTIYHNAACSKSREALQILQDNNLSPEVINYLADPPTPLELKELIGILGVSARDLLRTTEPVYKDAELDDDTLTDDEIIEAICEYPALLQRPIVISDGRAIIGRPPTSIMEIVA